MPKLFICKRKIHHKGRKRFFPTVSIRSESNRNDFSEKVFVQIKMIHISILSYSLNSVRKRLKQFLEKVFVKITQFRVCPSSVSIDYTLLLGARRSCGQCVVLGLGHAKVGFCVFGTHKSGHLCMCGVGVGICIVCHCVCVVLGLGHAKMGFCVFGTHKSGHLCM